MEKNKKELVKAALAALLLSTTLPIDGHASDIAGQKETLLAMAGCAAHGCGASPSTPGSNTNNTSNTSNGYYRANNNYDTSSNSYNRAGSNANYTSDANANTNYNAGSNRDASDDRASSWGTTNSDNMNRNTNTNQSSWGTTNTDKMNMTTRPGTMTPPNQTNPSTPKK